MRIPRMANLVFLVGLLITTAGCTTIGANVHEYTNWKTGKLGHLSQFIGTTNYEAVFDDSFVRRAMEKLLGDNVSHLLQNMEVRSPIESEGPELALWGRIVRSGHGLINGGNEGRGH